MYLFQTPNSQFQIRIIAPGIFRVMMSDGGKFLESLLSRYHILEEPGDLEGTVEESAQQIQVQYAHASLCVDKTQHTVTFTSTGLQAPLCVKIEGVNGGVYHNNGYRLQIPLEENERLYGIGDEARQSIARRGTVAQLNTINIRAYGPVPYVLSSNGYSILVNSTYPQTYDMGAADKDLMVLDVPKGGVDFYVFLPQSGSIVDNVCLSTTVTGKPMVMPKSFYGMTFVMNEMTDQRAMLYDCKEFRREDIPCDMIGLEPQWMSKPYDFTTEKTWSPERFRINEWQPQNTSDEQTFYNALKNMGFKLSLWLCINYDFLWEEERRIGGETPDPNVTYSFEGAKILDTHFTNAVYIDEITKRDEPWFEHLKRFVDNGASAFKLDACTQVLHHPDRLWGGKYLDDEVHNVYPVLYARQMKEDFEAYTNGRRALIYTPCIYAGMQKYAASWAGDTGGGFDTVIAMLNFAFCGHTNVTCDMDPTPAGLHYGFFSPWVQYMGWNNWLQPWFLTEEMEQMVREYSKLRSALFPYIYSMAHVAHQTGLPIVRPLPMMYPDNPAYDDVKNVYLFGDAFLVGVFDMNLMLPKGEWIDYFTGETYDGEQSLTYQIPAGHGGALFVRAGSIVVKMAPQPWIEKIQPTHYDVELFVGADADFTLCDDDGLTNDYLNGQIVSTAFVLRDQGAGCCTLQIGERQGSYAGRRRAPDAQNSEPVVHGMGPVESFTVKVCNRHIASVRCNGETLDVQDDSFFVPAEKHAAGALSFEIKLA